MTRIFSIQSGAKKHVHNILVENPEQKGPAERSQHTSEDTIKLDLK
jgi:hypothetical protein